MIKFGTDGWRAIIADDFTFENVRRVTDAICRYVLNEESKEDKEPVIIIGYDTRFLSEQFAQEAACSAASNGLRVLLADSFAPTPAISFSVVDQDAAGAIILTASHNSYTYNGLKFKASYGGSAGQRITERIEYYLKEVIAEEKAPPIPSFEDARSKNLIKLFDPKPSYLKHIKNKIGSKALLDTRVHVVVDPMFGAGQQYLSQLLTDLGCRVYTIHDKVDPCFGGLLPEPSPENLKELSQEVMKGHHQIGLALDGDADRISAIDADGKFVSSHQIFALLLEHLVTENKWEGDVVKTVSTTSMIEILADQYDLVVRETPIGFKYICEHMIEGDVLIGGEESGGIGIKGHIPERDGILIGAMLVELIALSGKTLGELTDELMNRIGQFYYSRVDLGIDDIKRKKLVGFLKSFSPREIADVPVESINDMDGYKFCLNDKSWVMIRLSGTEDVVRIYCEASSQQRVDELIGVARQIIDGAL